MRSKPRTTARTPTERRGARSEATVTANLKAKKTYITDAERRLLAEKGQGLGRPIAGRAGDARDARDDSALVPSDDRGEVRWLGHAALSGETSDPQRRDEAAADDGPREPILGLHPPARSAARSRLRRGSLHDPAHLARERDRAGPAPGQDAFVEHILAGSLGRDRSADFFSVEVLTVGGLVRHFVFFVIDLRTRRVHVAGVSNRVPTAHGWRRSLAISRMRQADS
jgi:hypothetical protein